MAASGRRRVPALRTAHALPIVGMVLVGLPLALGGAFPVTVPIACTLAVVAVACTGIDLAALGRDRLAHAAVLLIGITALQLAPLPSWLLAVIDSRSADLSARTLAAFGDAGTHWRALHLDPGNGYTILQQLVGLLAMYVATKQLEQRGYGKQVLDIAAFSILWVAILALAHKAFGLDKVYGIYTLHEATTTIIAPLANANHLAALSGAGAILWTGRAVASSSLPIRILNACGALLTAAVCILTLSRGGVAAAAGGLVLLLLVIRFGANENRRHAPSRRMLAAAAVLVFVLAGALMVGFGAMRREYAIEDWSKLQVIRGFLRAVVQHPVLGSGLGGGHAAVSTGGTLPGDLTFLWAESLPVDLAVGVGPIAAFAVIGLAAMWLLRLRGLLRRGDAMLTAGFCALVSYAVHDLLDYALWLGGNAYLAAAIAGVLSSANRATISRPSERPRRVRPATAFGAIAIASALAAFVTARSTLTQDRDRAEAMLHDGTDLNALRTAIARHPADPYLPMVAASLALREHDPRALRFINRALQLAPAWYQPHFILARVLIARGLRSQAIVELREAARLDGASELTGAMHGDIALTFAALRPTPDEIERVIPPGPMAVPFLRLVAQVMQSQPGGAAADRLLLARNPGDPDALEHEAARAHEENDFLRERSILTQLAANHPDRATPTLRLAQLDEDAGDVASAERELRRGLAHTQQPGTFLSRLGELETRSHNTATMRAAMQQWLDSVDGDIDARVQILGELGAHELALGNDAAALVAFERADSMAYPAHPYLSQVIRIAARAGDLPRLRGACNTLQDTGELTPELRGLCSPAMALGAAAM